MERIWEVVTTLVADFNRLFTSGEGVERIRSRLADPWCYVLFAVFIGLGVILALHGYKLAKFATVAASVGAGFTFGLGVVNPFIFAHIEMTPTEAFWLRWVAPVSLAIIFAVLMLRFVRFAFFAIGGLRVAPLGQHAGDSFGIVLIHLAPESYDVVCIISSH